MTAKSKIAVFLAVAVVAIGGVQMAAQRERLVQGAVVFKSTGNAVGNATVTFELPTRRQKSQRVTDSGGRFSFGTREVGVVSVAHPGYAPAYRRWPPLFGNDVIIELEPAATVSGTLTDSLTGAPLAGRATVTVEQIPHQSVSVSAESLPDGSFTVGGLPSGEAAVFAFAEGYAPAVSAMFDLAAGAVWTENLSLQLGVSLSGQVLNSAGEPVPGAGVAFEYSSSTGNGGVLAGFVGGKLYSDLEGMFELANLSPGETLQLWAEDGDNTTDVATVFVAGGGQEIVLRFP